jgi:serine/threonine protein kinase
VLHQVWQVRRKTTGDIYAMKALDKKDIIEQDLVQHTITEREVMLSISHPFIINLKFAFQTEDKLYFVLDYIDGGSLFQLFADLYDGYFSTDAARFYAAEVLLGLEALHKANIVYRYDD